MAAQLQEDLLSRWDPAALDLQVRRSQRRRGLIERVHNPDLLEDVQELGNQRIGMRR